MSFPFERRTKSNGINRRHYPHFLSRVKKAFCGEQGRYPSGCLGTQELQLVVVDFHIDGFCVRSMSRKGIEGGKGMHLEKSRPPPSFPSHPLRDTFRAGSPEGG